VLQAEPSSDGDGRQIYRTTALGCRAEIQVSGARSLVGAIEILHQELERIDRAASRFRSDSEIAGVQRAGGRPVKVSRALFEAVAVALRVAELTDGAVDPTVGGALVSLGYDRDFAQLTQGVDGPLPPATPVPGWQCLELNQSAGTLRVPVGVEVDLGATAKALTADRIARRAQEVSGGGVLVSLGGDIAVAGPPPPGGFVIGLADVAAEPAERIDQPGLGETVAIESGGLATSGTAKRQWRLGEHTVHHIVDPATGRPTWATWRTVTVAAASCVDANAASTASMVKAAAAIDWLEARHLPARLVAVTGRTVRLGGWPDAAQSPARAIAEARR
jgi:thiamine biosynthesis lipoprotein